MLSPKTTWMGSLVSRRKAVAGITTGADSRATAWRSRDRAEGSGRSIVVYADIACAWSTVALVRLLRSATWLPYRSRAAAMYSASGT
jgi:hypothetical protein